MKVKNFAILMCFVALVGCGGKKIAMNSGNYAVAPGKLSMTVGWIKDKASKLDIHLSLKDESNESAMIVYLHDIGCYRGDQHGDLKHTFFNTGERTIDFKPGQTKSFNVVCKLGSEGSGPLRVVIAKVYDNPGFDGKTAGKILATNIEWKNADDTAGAEAKQPAAASLPDAH